MYIYKLCVPFEFENFKLQFIQKDIFLLKASYILVCSIYIYIIRGHRRTKSAQISQKEDRRDI